MMVRVQQFSLSTAIIAFWLISYYRVDARNAGGDAPLSPPCDPPSGSAFSTKIIINNGGFILITQFQREWLLPIY
jgi:hypothetical protein